MKAVLEFTLPEESAEHQTALDGWKWKAVIEALDNRFRARAKYDAKPHIEVSMCRDWIREALEDRGLRLD